MVTLLGVLGMHSQRMSSNMREVNTPRGIDKTLFAGICSLLYFGILLYVLATFSNVSTLETPLLLHTYMFIELDISNPLVTCV